MHGGTSRQGGAGPGERWDRARPARTALPAVDPAASGDGIVDTELYSRSLAV